MAVSLHSEHAEARGFGRGVPGGGQAQAQHPPRVGRRDDAVLNALLSSVYQLAQNEKAGPLRRHLEKLADAIICAADESVRGEIQRTLLASRVDEIRKTGYLDFRAELRKLPDASPDH